MFFHLLFRFTYYSNSEVDFQKAWSNAVEYLATFNFHTTMSRVHGFQESLPPVILTNEDKVPFIKDFSGSQNIFIYILTSLEKVDSTSGKYLIKKTP